MIIFIKWSANLHELEQSYKALLKNVFGSLLYNIGVSSIVKLDEQDAICQDILYLALMFDVLKEFLGRYSSITVEEFNMLQQQVEVRNYDKKTRLTEIGEVEQNLYFVVKGLTRKYFLKGKDEIITHIVKEGGIIGSAASFFSGKPSRYIVEAIEPTMTVSVSRHKLEQLFRSGNKWEKIGRMMTTHFFLQQEYRILDNIRLTTKERFIKFMNENPDLLQRVPQKHLASYLNIKPETFSRMKHLMIDKKVVKEDFEKAV